MTNTNYLAHHGIQGQKWGIRRYQNEDGTLTPEGLKRYRNSDLHKSDTENYDKIQKDLASESRKADNRSKAAKIVSGMGMAVGAIGGMGLIGIIPAISIVGASATAGIIAEGLIFRQHNKKVSDIENDPALSNSVKRINQYIDYLLDKTPRNAEGELRTPVRPFPDPDTREVAEWW